MNTPRKVKTRKDNPRLPALDDFGQLSTDVIHQDLDPRPVAVDGKAPATAEFQKALEHADKLVDDAWSTETQRAYQSDWMQFEKFCLRMGREAMPADADTVRAFIAHQHKIEGKRPSTLRRRIIAIRMVHERFEEPWPDVDEKLIKQMKGIRRKDKRPVKKRTAAVDADIKRMADHCVEGTNKGMRDRALLLFGYATAMRRSELVRLTVEDLEETEKGYKVTVPYSKTDQEAEGDFIAVLKRDGSRYCPVQALKDWMTVAGIRRGSVFLRMHRFDKVSKRGQAMSGQSVALLVKEYAVKAKLDPTNYAGHSLRRGFMTSAAEAGDDLGRLAAHSRHKKLEMVQAYIDEADKFKKPAGEGLLRDE